MERTCGACHKSLPIEAFNKGNNEGKQAYCRECQRVYRAAYYKQHREKELKGIATYYAEHSDVLRAKRRERSKDPEAAARDAITTKKWLEANIEAVQARRAEHSRLHKPWRKWIAANPEKFAIKNREAQKRRRTIPDGGSPVSYDAILKRDGFVCYLCEKEVLKSDLNFDHVIPLGRGGRHEESNIRVSHALCNRRKGNRTPDEIRRTASGGIW